MSKKRLEGKVALVTGGSRGIGAAIAHAFAREGAKVVIASRKAPELEATAAKINAEHPGAVMARACHTGQPAAIEELVAWIEKEIGVVDVAVNNAATNPHFGPLLGADDAAWDKTFDVNLKGYFAATRAVVEHLQARNAPGSIVNIASIAGIRAAPLQGVYGMTKAAVISMTRTLAQELGGAGIRVNAIAPGLVETRFAAAIVGSDALRDHVVGRTALGRHAQPDEIAGAALYLASDASSYVTGQVLVIDGGATITM